MQPAHFTVLEVTPRDQGSELSSATMIPQMTAADLCSSSVGGALGCRLLFCCIQCTETCRVRRYEASGCGVRHMTVQDHHQILSLRQAGPSQRGGYTVFSGRYHSGCCVACSHASAVEATLYTRGKRLLTTLACKGGSQKRYRLFFFWLRPR